MPRSRPARWSLILVVGAAWLFAAFFPGGKDDIEDVVFDLGVNMDFVDEGLRGGDGLEGSDGRGRGDGHG